MTRHWHIRPYGKGDEEEILNLRRAVFGDLDPVRLKKSTWRWQFEENPAGSAFYRLAEAGHRVVGQYVTIPTRLLVDGRETLAAFSCDTMIHPEYRRQGMFSALAQELYDDLEKGAGIGLVWGFPNEQSLPGFTRKLDWKMLPPIPLMVVPIRPLAVLLKMLPATGRLVGNRFPSPAADKPLRIVSRIKGLAIEAISRFDESFDELWHRHKASARIIQVRDSRYLQWRYLSVPQFGYRPFAVFRDRKLLGFIVIRMMALRGQRFGVLVDVFPFPVNAPVFRDIISFARQYVVARGGHFLTCLMPRHHLGILRKTGFLRVPEVFNPKTWRLGYRRTKDRLLGSAESWHVTYGDSDVV